MISRANSFIGLGVGSRWPDYTIGARNRYITMRALIIGFILSGLATFAVYFPIAIYIVTYTVWKMSCTKAPILKKKLG